VGDSGHHHPGRRQGDRGDLPLHPPGQRRTARLTDVTGQHDQRWVEHDAGRGDAERQPAGQFVEHRLAGLARGHRGPDDVGRLGAAEAVLFADRLGRVATDEGLEGAPDPAARDVAWDLRTGHRQPADLTGGAG
jgi:hypothetical protein